MKDSGKRSAERGQHSLNLSLNLNTHIFVILWYQDVHLRALGTDDVTVQGILIQVDLAALCLVDGNGGNSSQHLEQHLQFIDRYVWHHLMIPNVI